METNNHDTLFQSLSTLILLSMKKNNKANNWFAQANIGVIQFSTQSSDIVVIRLCMFVTMSLIKSMYVNKIKIEKLDSKCF